MRFETSKTEAVLLTKRRRLWRKKKRRPIQVGDRRIFFADGAVRWLGVWLGSSLALSENRRRCVNRARQAEARIRRLVNKNGIPPTSARNVQTAIVQGTLLYASELTWQGSGAKGAGGKAMERDYQKIINRMGRATIGAFQPTPLGILAAESKLAPAGPLLDFRQACFAKRLMARPKGHHGPEEILERRRAELTERLRQISSWGRRRTQRRISGPSIAASWERS